MVDEIACPDCAEKIKAEAKVCRFCGLRLQPVETPDSQISADTTPNRVANPRWMNITIFVVIGIMFFGLMFELSGINDVSFKGPDKELVSAAKSVIAQQLSDPASAQYENITTLGDCLIGKVNAKNRMGGYVGFQEFIYYPSSKSVVLDVGLPEEDLPLGLGTEQLARHSEFLEKRMDCSGSRQSAETK